VQAAAAAERGVVALAAQRPRLRPRRGRPPLRRYPNPGNAGNEFYYTDTLILLVRSICVVKDVTSEWKKGNFRVCVLDEADRLFEGIPIS